MYGGWWNSAWWPWWQGYQGWAEAPQGKGRGVGPSPDASTGKGCKGAKDGKGRTEAPAGTAGVERENKKRSEMTDAEKREEMKKHRAEVFARRTSDAYVARDQWIDGFRTPIGHRFGHKRPKEWTHFFLLRGVGLQARDWTNVSRLGA